MQTEPTDTAPTNTAPTDTAPTDTAPPLGRLYEVNGQRLSLHRSGTGGPSVVFLPGAGLVGLDFLNVHNRAAELTTSVLYDRGGTGWSEDVDLPRAAAAVAGELRQLLRTAEVPAPYLLVGHSMGALYARRFAQLFPDDVFGLLLLDPGHEDIMSYLPEKAVELNEQVKPDVEAMPELTEEQRQTARGQYAQLYADWPDSVLAPLVEHHLTDWRTQLHETKNLEDEVYGELRQAGAQPDVPMIVLTAMGRNPYWAQFLSEELMREAQQGVHNLHAAIAGSVSQGEHREVAEASHQYLHIEKPDVVVQAIADLLGKGQPRTA
jgi:pimeloyl-ACP methyl ester carboxylesterase